MKCWVNAFICPGGMLLDVGDAFSCGRRFLCLKRLLVILV